MELVRMSRHALLAPPSEVPAARELLLDLPSPRRPVAVGVLLLWLGGWAFGIGFMFQQLLSSGPFGPDRIFLVAWLLLWALAGCGALVYLAWLIAGRERVSLEGGALVIRRGVWGAAVTRRWPLDSIRRLRTFGREISPVIAFGLEVAGQGASGVQFESGGRVVRFARTLSERDARAVVQLLLARCSLDRGPDGSPHSPPAEPGGDA